MNRLKEARYYTTRVLLCLNNVVVLEIIRSNGFPDAFVVAFTMVILYQQKRQKKLNLLFFNCKFAF
jgi:hypothetical protein